MHTNIIYFIFDVLKKEMKKTDLIFILVLTAILSSVLDNKSTRIAITVSFFVLILFILLNTVIIQIVAESIIKQVKNKRYSKNIKSLLSDLDDTHINRMSISMVLFAVYLSNVINYFSMTLCVDYFKTKIEFTYPAFVVSLMSKWILSSVCNLFSMQMLFKRLKDELDLQT